MNYELMHFNRPDAHMQCQSRKLFSRSQGSARRHLSAAAVQASLLLGMFPSDGYMLMEENGAEPASRTARARPRRRSCILRVAVGEGRPDMDPWRYRERMGEIEQGDQRDLAAGSGTATAAGSGEGSWREWRAGRWLTE
jgi:hypothetical protein